MGTRGDISLLGEFFLSSVGGVREGHRIMDGFSPHASLSSIVQACITVSIIHIRCYSTGYLCNNTQEASLIILGKKLNFSNFTFFPS